MSRFAAGHQGTECELSCLLLPCVGAGTTLPHRGGGERLRSVQRCRQDRYGHQDQRLAPPTGQQTAPTAASSWRTTQLLLVLPLLELLETNPVRLNGQNIRSDKVRDKMLADCRRCRRADHHRHPDQTHLRAAAGDRFRLRANRQEGPQEFLPLAGCLSSTHLASVSVCVWSRFRT